MYLNAKRYLSDYDKKDKAIKDKIKPIFKDLDFEVEEVSFKVFYWRKANAIHRWFVENVQEGDDDCGKYEVTIQQLQKLLETINKVLGVNDKEKIVNELSKEYNYEHLPVGEGFFFGSNEYDEYYIEDLKNTKEMLEKLLKNKEKYEKVYFEYSSSW